jgi:hypothetical protein
MVKIYRLPPTQNNPANVILAKQDFGNYDFELAENPTSRKVKVED